MDVYDIILFVFVYNVLQFMFLWQDMSTVLCLEQN